MRSAWRLLVTEPLDGATNMAVDEALLRARSQGAGAPTVRFYGWRPATVSLGYAQPLDETIDRARCDELGLGLVRRPTGGSAILHEGPEGEVTYSVVARGGDFPGAEDVLETYRVIGQGLRAGLDRLGAVTELVPLVRGRRDLAATPAFCFRRAGAYELAVSGRKLVGSAQRRQRGAFLQHGSVVLDADPVRIRAIFPREPEPMAGMTTLAAVLGSRPRFDAVVAALAGGLAEALEASLELAGLSAEEQALADTLVAEKYTTEAWTVFGRTPSGPGSAGIAAGTAAGARTGAERPGR
jgi:lipoate-protein ligase A